MSQEQTQGWRRSSWCYSGDCVEVDVLPGSVRVRDSKNPDVILTFSTEEWDLFARGVARGEFSHSRCRA